MKKFLRKGISLFMAAVMAFGTGVSAFAEDGFISLAPIEEPEEIISEEDIFEETEYIEEKTELLNASAEKSLEEIIRPQIEAYAKSIDQKDANKKAQDALLGHGMRGKGKKLSVGESHAITATLMNSELTKYYLAKVCAMLIETANEQNIDKMYSVCGNIWKINSKNSYQIFIYDYDATNIYDSYGYVSVPNDFIKCVRRIEYNKSNAYDDSLELLAGETSIETDIKQIEICEDKIVYEVSNWVHDKFDFSAENGSSLENLLGFIGLLLFNPFEWESKFSFQIEVPNDCEHSYESVVTKSTCTEKGSVTYTCTLCGYSYTEEIAAKDHSLGEWSVYAKPTVGKAGEERRTCANCDYYESKEIAAYRYGDVNCDGKVNTVDANYVRRYSAGLLTLDERQMLAADVDGNGAINVLDSAIIRRYVVKYITSLPHKETA
ncbi:MAG: dockerin type I repeat-containing protein [Oscillospiraceae bacterium]|nr:dockerin type I repeat-containing protein [Oscillospiraceae bacterium]MBQ3560934.1 dockerin type I repeat-containing protein [Oscillospiraceae bacterium]MBQ6701244.1 dockerin type I repeat-containing protein [Oscillospiraceae bacterium]MBQ6801717.1 dockerin type I repeat-containing protein [Oscillospiraceae bacterium]